MANKPLKSIKFPGLDDTYTIPQVDNTLAVSGAAADAKKTGDAIGDLKSALDTVAETIPSPNIFDNSFPVSGLINTAGEDQDSPAYKRTDYLPIDGTKSTLYFIRDKVPYILYICFYDENKTGISSGGANARVQLTNQTTTAKTGSVAIPSGAVWYRVATHATNFDGTLCLTYTYTDTVFPYGSSFVVSKAGSMYGKKIAFFGDSIVGAAGAYSGLTGICSWIGLKSGATVYNCAFGGTRMAYRYGSAETYPNWNALSGVGLANAVASGDWTAQDTAVANLTDHAEFAARLADIKNVDWSKVDFILWEYGTNDFMTEVKLTDTEDTTNLYAYDNAYKTAIEAIQTAYPNIRIIPVTPIYRWYRDENTNAFIDDSNTHEMADYAGTRTKLTDFVAMVQTIAREYQLPCIDDYYTLGANRFTRLAYFDSTDGTHPNAQGRERIAGHIVGQMNSVV